MNVDPNLPKPLKPLLASLDDDAYLKDGINLDKAKQAGQPGEVDPGKPPDPSHLSNDGASPNDLKQQRWGVIVPEGKDGDELFARIAPLIAQREKEQGDKLFCAGKGQPFRVPPQLSFDDASQWIQDNLNPMKDWQRPRYLLMLGHPDQVPIELQQALSVYYFAGRLAFDNLDGYSQYAAKAVDFANPDAFSASSRVLSYTVRTESAMDAPDDGFAKLMAPIIDLSAEEDSQVKPFVDACPKAGTASAQHFLQMARDPNPTVLMSLSHGIGRSRNRPWSDEEIRKFQGMMYFGAKKDPLRPEDVATGDFLPGGMWYFFACFGAGTPAESAYWHWLQKINPNMDVLNALPKNGKSFIAALPQAALANRRGPLAVMGHLDLAWNYSYDSKMTRHNGQAQRFMSLSRLARRDDKVKRVGQVFQTLLGDLPLVQTDLTNKYNNEAMALAKGTAVNVDPKERASLWMLRQDLRAYILLGDPAAYMPLQKEPEAPPEPVEPDGPVWIYSLNRQRASQGRKQAGRRGGAS